MPDITILNGKKHMRRHMTRRARRNPDESLTSQAGSAALATVIAAPIAVALDRSIAGMKKKDGALRYTPNQSAMLLAGIGAVGGIALHVNGYAPRAGVALLSACAAVALKRSYDARSGQRPAVTPPGQPRVIPPPAATTTPALPATTTTPALPATTTTPTTATTPAATTPATVSAQQTQAPSTPATPGPTETPAVTPSGAIIRRAGAVYAAQYGQVSRTGAALEAERFQGYALEKPRVISAMASSEEIQGEQMVPRGILRPAFIKGGRASDMVQTLPRMEGVVRPRRVTQTVDPMAGTTVRRSGEIDMLGDMPMERSEAPQDARPMAAPYNPPPTPYDAGWQRMQVRGDCSIEVRNAGPQGTPPMSVSTGQLPFGFSNVSGPVISALTPAYSAREYDERLAAQMVAEQDAAARIAAQQQAEQDAEIARKVLDKVGASSGAGPVTQAERDARLAQLGERTSIMGGLASFDKIRQQQRRQQQQQQDCVCPSPSGARVMRRPQQ